MSLPLASFLPLYIPHKFKKIFIKYTFICATLLLTSQPCVLPLYSTSHFHFSLFFGWHPQVWGNGQWRTKKGTKKSTRDLTIFSSFLCYVYLGNISIAHNSFFVNNNLQRGRYSDKCRHSTWSENTRKTARK